MEAERHCRSLINTVPLLSCFLENLDLKRRATPLDLSPTLYTAHGLENITRGAWGVELPRTTPASPAPSLKADWIEGTASRARGFQILSPTASCL